MRVVIIGAGNVATVLARMMTKANHEIIQVVGRDLNHARFLAQQFGCPFTNNAALVDTTAGIYVAAVGDAALDHLHESFFLGDKLIVHTAGALSKDVLSKISVNYGVMYPLQSLRKEYAQLHQLIPLLVDGSSESAISAIENFALTISSVVVKASDDQRLKLHLAAVIVNNFTNHLYELAAGYCDSEQIDFKMLQPLIEETAFRLREHLPVDVQTGPAIRKDIITIDKHLRILSEYPALKKIYLEMTDSIMNAAPAPE